MLTYEESLDFIHGIARFGSKPGLRRVAMLLERMGNPQNKLRFIHVAGTDGKGSTCTAISHMFAAAEYKTGLYISPYVLDFCERIQINNQMIAKDELAYSTSIVKAHWDALDAIGETPTEFEVVVAVAMDYFLRQNCDLIVLEVGMGGRFDATNIIPPPLCSVITHISMDHMEYLGDTIELLAAEKCGIIKKESITVSYPRQEDAPLSIIMEHCAKQENALHIPGHAEVLSQDIFGSHIQYGDLDLQIQLPGEHQIYNTLTAIEAVRAVSARVPALAVNDAQIAQGIASVRFPSRVEVLSRDPFVLLDGGHNPAEAQALAAALSLLPGRRIHAVIGMLADKDVDAVLAAILPQCAACTAITPHYPRAMPARQLAAYAKAYCKDVRISADSGDTLTELLAQCGKEDVLLVCGSLYLASEMRPILLALLEQPCA